ncbi:RhuM family protein [Breznakia pachnodae]|uniref:Prophage maintenance system killer protein n=1 Tax=Breznakia pachnodae TaxID=265178 RepID=A0ABU0E603_9FIRM|nr:RhuM family protein [Breznakia pachnodae]MDQ0362339.1 prophage maintenance system killer protein [Breznakia pachnodae]
MTKKEVMIFKDGSFEVNVNIDLDGETVWLTRKQVSELFDRDVKTIGKHINNVLKEELDNEDAVVAKFATTANDGKSYNIDHYNLDVIISVGYRVKSNRGVLFRKWANSVLKQYLLDGYVVNERRSDTLDYSKVLGLLNNLRTKNMMDEITGEDLLGFLDSYQRGLEILDNYDHHTLTSPNGIQDIYKLTYNECIDIIRKSSFEDKDDLFAIERDDSFHSSIQTIYQTYDGIEMYPTLELKAANLLYLVTKNHSFIDGNKRIAAIVFLYFLQKNNNLKVNGVERISNETLVTLTILIASSNPEDKENVVNLITVLIAK